MNYLVGGWSRKMLRITYLNTRPIYYLYNDIPDGRDSLHLIDQGHEFSSTTQANEEPKTGHKSTGGSVDSDDMAVIAALALEEMGIPFRFVFKTDGRTFYTVEVVAET